MIGGVAWKMYDAACYVAELKVLLVLEVHVECVVEYSRLVETVN